MKLAGAGLTIAVSLLLVGWQKDCGGGARNALTGDYKTLLRVQVTPAESAGVVDRVKVDFVGDIATGNRDVPFTSASDAVTIPVADGEDKVQPARYLVRLIDRCGTEITRATVNAGITGDEKNWVGPDLVTVAIPVPAGYVVAPCGPPAATPSPSDASASASPSPAASAGPSPTPTATPTPRPVSTKPVGQMIMGVKRTRYTPNQSADAEVSVTYLETFGDDTVQLTSDDFRDRGFQMGWELRDAATEAVLKAGTAAVTAVPTVIQATALTPTVPSLGIKGYWKLTLTAPGRSPLLGQSKSFVLADPPSP